MLEDLLEEIACYCFCFLADEREDFTLKVAQRSASNRGFIYRKIQPFSIAYHALGFGSVWQQAQTVHFTNRAAVVTLHAIVVTSPYYEIFRP
ncbi:hypothetical protein TUM3792_22220 [Shewanella sp. MBTL60-007]|nr:hypothetical protein TUM3792_22220 [Shewanella sp. MBTL60-007]